MITHSSYKNKKSIVLENARILVVFLTRVANWLPLSIKRPGDLIYMFSAETGSFMWEGEYFGHHPEFVLKGEIKELNWQNNE